jgi:hypothetical protein
MAIAFLGKLVFCSYFSKPRKKLYSTGAMTLSVMTLNIKGLFATFSIMALSTTTVVIVLNTVMLSVAFFYCYAECHYAECRVFCHAECNYSEYRCPECHCAECRSSLVRAVTFRTNLMFKIKIGLAESSVFNFNMGEKIASHEGVCGLV